MGTINARRAEYDPATSVQLLKECPSSVLKAIRYYELTRLLTWSILERRPRQDPDYDRTLRRKKYANDAGVFVLAYYMHRKRKTSPQIGRLLTQSGGLLRFWYAENSFSLFREACDSQTDLHYVYQLVRYMCRCEQDHCRTAQQKRIGAAKFVLSKQSNSTLIYGSVSEIDKIWSMYKDAAPYIFAFFPYLQKSFGKDNRPSPDQFMRFVKALARNPTRLNRILGRAAYAADVLSKRGIQGVRMSDFENIAQIRFSLPKFSEEEAKLIDKYDPTRLTKREEEDYRAPLRRHAGQRKPKSVVALIP
jgi:hypothetical protein